MTMHEQVAELLPAFALGDLPGPQASRVQAHLAECEDCRAAFGRLQGLLSHTDRMQDLAIDPAAAKAASERLLASVQPAAVEGPQLRVLSFRSTFWTRLKESRIMQSRSKRVVAALAAAIVVALGSLTVFHTMFSAQPAWAFDDTIAALRDVQVVHLSGEGNLSEKMHFTADIWANADENGLESRDARAVLHMGDLEQVLVVHDGRTHDYKTFTKEVVVYSGKGIALNPWPGSKFFERMKKEGEDVAVTYGKDPQTQRDSVYLTCSNQKFVKSWWWQFDAQTRLPVRMKEWKNLRREGLPTFDFARIVYDQPLPSDFFEFQIPPGVKVSQGTGDSDSAPGIRTEGLSRDAASRRIATEYWQALIDADWSKAHDLRPALSQEEYRSAYPGNPPVEIVQVEQPYDQPGCDSGPVVPCKIRFRNGNISTIKMMVRLREINGQNSIIIDGIWGMS